MLRSRVPNSPDGTLRGGTMRLAPPPNPNTPGRGGRGGGGGRGQTVDLPVRRPDTSFRADDWNEIEIYLDANIVRPHLNGGGEIGGGAADDEAGKYGPI